MYSGYNSFIRSTYFKYFPNHGLPINFLSFFFKTCKYLFLGEEGISVQMQGAALKSQCNFKLWDLRYKCYRLKTHLKVYMSLKLSFAYFKY